MPPGLGLARVPFPSIQTPQLLPVAALLAPWQLQDDPRLGLLKEPGGAGGSTATSRSKAAVRSADPAAAGARVGRRSVVHGAPPQVRRAEAVALPRVVPAALATLGSGRTLTHRLCPTGDTSSALPTAGPAELRLGAVAGNCVSA